MNVERMNELADRLDEVPDMPPEAVFVPHAVKDVTRVDFLESDSFNIGEWACHWEDPEDQFGKCGTAACVAGWACILFGRGVDLHRVADTAASILGLNRVDSNELFNPPGAVETPTAKDAARALRRAASGAKRKDWWKPDGGE